MKETHLTTETDVTFVVHSYTKAELAMLYCPGRCISGALETLYRWIRANSELMNALEKIHYNKYRRSFTPGEVSLIVKYLGEP